MRENNLKYGDKIIYMEGVIVEVHDGCIGSVAPVHIGFIGGGGNQQKFKEETGPKIARILKEEGVDGVLLTAG